MKIKGVLFDLDGTLINTTPLILESFRHTFVEFGLPVPSKEALVAGFGLPLRTAVKAYMPESMIEDFVLLTVITTAASTINLFSRLTALTKHWHSLQGAA